MSRPTVTLAEHDSTVQALPPAAARQVADLAQQKLSVGIGPKAGTWTVKATQHVGTLATPDVEVLVRPKIPLQNLFLLLDVDLPPVAWGTLPFGYAAATDDLLAAFGTFFARTLERAIGNGLLRSYRPHTERLFALRGRVLLNETIRSPATPIPVPCEFDEHTADNDENRYLKAAASRLLRTHGVRADTKQSLRRHLALFDEVADTEPRAEAVDKIVLTRLNRHYEPALRLARLVLENLGLIDQVGGYQAASFLLDMNDLFQRWVTARLQRHLRGRLVVQAEPNVALGEGGLVPMNPDLCFSRRDEVVYVGDIKYKLTATGAARAGDYYQLLAYTTAMGLDEGILIYCQSSGDVPEREVIVRNTGARLRTCAIDLRGGHDDIETAVAGLAELIERRIGR